MGKAGLIGGVVAWVLAAALTLAASTRPEYIKPHPYLVAALGIAGLFMLLVPVVELFSPIFKNEKRKPYIALTTEPGRTFALVHLGGEAAQHIQVEPIRSILGKPLWIRFDPVDFLTEQRHEVFPTYRLDIGGHLKGEGDRGMLEAVLFCGDAEGRETVDYPVTISFEWKGREMTERQTLTWHSASMTLTTSEARK